MRLLRASLNAMLMQGFASVSVGFGIFLLMQADNTYVYVPALAMVGIPCVQGLRQWRANRLAHRWVRTFQRTIREEDMALQMARIRAWNDVPTFWLISCPELQDSSHPRATMNA